MLVSCRRKRLLIGIVALVGATGCQRPEPAPHAPRELPAIVLNTPEDAARSVLLGLQSVLQAVADNDRPALKECLEHTRAALAEGAIQQMLARRPQIRAMLGEDPIEGLINNWAAAIAYYAGVETSAQGIHFEQMYRASQTPAKVDVVVPASGPADSALIQVTCLHQEDGLWRVSRVELIPGTATRPAVTGPATQPASEPS